MLRTHLILSQSEYLPLSLDKTSPTTALKQGQRPLYPGPSRGFQNQHFSSREMLLASLYPK